MSRSEPRQRRRVVVDAARGPALSAQLGAARRAACLSYEDAASKLDVSAASLGRWERGDAVPSDAALKRIATTYAVDFGELAVLANREREMMRTRRFESRLAADEGAAGVPGLRQLRQGRGMTQRELARRLGKSTSAVASWENGRTAPDTETADAIAAALALDSDEFAVLARLSASEAPLVVPADGLRAWRVRKGMSAADVAHVIGDQQSRVTKYERGVLRPTVPTLRALSGVLDIPVEDVARSCGLPDPRPLPIEDWTPQTASQELAKLRRWHGLSQAELASSCGISRTLVRRWEEGGTPPARIVPVLAQVFGLDPAIAAKAVGYADIPPLATWTAGMFAAIWEPLKTLSGVTVAEIARAVGVTPPAVSQWEHRGAQPTDAQLEPLAELLRGRLRWHPDLKDLDARALATARKPRRRRGA